MGTYVCIQPNGERHPVERWAVMAWLQGRLTDPLILRSLVSAVVIYDPMDGRRLI
jgi:hypothetical protein